MLFKRQNVHTMDSFGSGLKGIVGVDPWEARLCPHLGGRFTTRNKIRPLSCLTGLMMSLETEIDNNKTGYHVLVKGSAFSRSLFRIQGPKSLVSSFFFFLSPVATKLRKGDIGLPFVRPSVRPSVRLE